MEMAKKTKIANDHSEIILDRLASDELNYMFKFLTFGGLINYSMTCQRNYSIIRDWISIMYPMAVEYVQNQHEYWSIATILRICKNVVIDASTFNFALFTKIAEQYRGNLKLLSEELEFNFFNFVNAKVYFEMEVKNFDSIYEKRKIPFVVLQPTVGFNFSNEGESTIEEKRIVKEKEIITIPLGFFMKNLKLYFEHLLSDMYYVLRFCHLVENLEISFGDSVSDEKYEDFYECPLLTSLKNLRIVSGCILDDVQSQKFVIDILKLTPNLLDLEIFFHNYCDVNILMYITRMCPNLEKISIDVDHGYGYIGVSINDEGLYGFLKALPKLKHLNLGVCHQISGDFYSRIGEFTQIEYFRVERRNGGYGQVLVDEVDNVKFGGGMLPNLYYLEIGNFSFSTEKRQSLLESLRLMAPKLARSNFQNQYSFTLQDYC
ncbi:predicted protein [Naegleria gruberi]|uniref:Predicted protein n=1 Tax=Naegleria gruberi TaxID=5762 RepID=D2VTQ5_NAEGR|nr:uncharacterized protein NAEGRDRAFT_72386 [Naegleria gruberi]EFC39766.1 predicted protein [Naegleria gruberi]|eukprot:XP_002672510.1 predicted protein [Naegleria gruberi strain NEG-M]